MPTDGSTRVKAPLFEEFTAAQLHGLTGYEESYLESLAAGRQQIRPRFRKVVSRMLGRPESELFADVHTPGANGVSGQTRENGNNLDGASAGVEVRTSNPDRAGSA